MRQMHRRYLLRRMERSCMEKVPAHLCLYSLVKAFDFVGRETKVGIALLNPVVESHPRIALGERVVRYRDHFHAIEETLDDIPGDCRLYQIPVLDPELRSAALLQRCPVADLSVPPDDFHISILGLQASPEHLVSCAAVRR